MPSYHEVAHHFPECKPWFYLIGVSIDLASNFPISSSRSNVYLHWAITMPFWTLQFQSQESTSVLVSPFQIPFQDKIFRSLSPFSSVSVIIIWSTYATHIVTLSSLFFMNAVLQVAGPDRSSIILPLSGLKQFHEMVGHFVEITKDRIEGMTGANVRTIEPSQRWVDLVGFG